ncbi:MAG TPA: L-threonylcarbamoyladenylate synthase [Salinisphaeraceae bacterium]|nr:L-threonylcarbamoyladenylate synthase [Salinisphaeraceae bacterium]
MSDPALCESCEQPAGNLQASGDRLRACARVLRAGGLVAHPTEGVWGLACDPHNSQAVRRLLAAKQRDPAKGLILIADRAALLAPYVAANAAAWQRACASWPGPSTWLLPAHSSAPVLITGGQARIALRVTAHPVAAALGRAFGGALVSTSANISKRPAALHAWQVRAWLGSWLDAMIGGRLSNPGQPSTITDAETGIRIRGAEQQHHDPV